MSKYYLPESNYYSLLSESKIFYLSRERRNHEKQREQGMGGWDARENEAEGEFAAAVTGRCVEFDSVAVFATTGKRRIRHVCVSS